MILDIRFYSKAPRQIQNVRRVSHYNDFEGRESPEIIIYPMDDTQPCEYIKLYTIREIVYTND